MAGTELELAWKGLRGELDAQAAYLRALDPTRLPALLGAALTAPLLASMARAALAALLPAEPSAAVALLEGLAATPRFDIISTCPYVASAWKAVMEMQMEMVWPRCCRSSPARRLLCCWDVGRYVQACDSGLVANTRTCLGVHRGACGAGRAAVEGLATAPR